MAIVNGETVTSIDTPGFDDTYLSDGEVLERIAMSLFTQADTSSVACSFYKTSICAE